MGLIARFWNWLTASAIAQPRKGHPDLYPIDIDKLAKELNLVVEAKRLGEVGLPTVGAKVLAGPEAAIVQRVEKIRQDYVDWAHLRQSVLNQDIGRINVTQDVNRASQADKEFERKASTLLTEQDSLLRGLNDAAKKRKAELEEFKTKNSLTREAHYPTATGTYLRYGLLFVLIGLEGILNSSFFAQGLDTGWLGGFTQAGILAATNVLVAFAFGKFAIRYIKHVGVSLKITGFTALALSVIIMLTIGLGVSHYRDSLISDVADPARAALQALLAGPFQLRDFFSWALFTISVAFGVLSLLDGLFSDDHYPGYGSISRRTQNAIDDYEDELNTLQSDLEELKNKELKSLDQTVQQAQSSVAVSETLIDAKRMANSRLSTALRDADHSLEALLQKFRTENEICRKGVPRPEYFDRQPDLRPIQIPDFDNAADEADLAKQRELVNALLASVEDIRARIQAAFNQQFDRLKPLGIHFPDKEMK